MKGRKGLSIFHKLFIAFSGIGLITLFISGVVHYQSTKKFVEQTILSHLSTNLQSSLAYFDNTFTTPIYWDLQFLEASPSLNNFLTAQKEEILLVKPEVEKLFLHFTGQEKKMYLSLRFIDVRGEEKIITVGKKRVRTYTSREQFPDEEVYRGIYNLFDKLKTAEPGTIVFEGPFQYEERKLTFLLGISKTEPEIGGFGGAIFFYCDLTEYLQYLSGLTFHDITMAKIFDPDRQLLFSPVEKDSSSDPDLFAQQAEDDFFVSAPIKLGSDNSLLGNLVLSLPRNLVSDELMNSLRVSALTVGGIILVVGFIAFVLSKNLIVKPLMALAQMATQLAHGDLNFTVYKDTSHDEIGVLATTFQTMKDTIGHALNELNVLIQAVQSGKLDIRGNADAFAGSWRELIIGMNTVVEVFVAPITTTAVVIDRIAQGDIPEKITEDYQGDFHEIKDDVNRFIDAMQAVTRVAKTMAEGDLTVEVQERSNRDTLMQALNTMTQRLNTVVSDVKSTAAHVATGSQTMSTSAEEMSQGTTEQAAMAEEVSSSMEEMVANIRQNADNARQTEKIALQSAEDARDSSEAVAEVVSAMKAIAKKISIIEEIASQTHMLSLNATIEAAKAEEHGKGFAVVASEVRGLAERSRVAAEEITELADSGVTAVERAGKTLITLVPNIQRTAELVQEISATSNAQNSGTEQINRAIQQLDQIIQQNASNSEEMASTAEELADQAAYLQHTMAFFRIDATTMEKRGEMPGAGTQEREQVEMTKRHGDEVIDMKTNGHGGDDLDTEFERY